ncbi:MAG: hypothetical protein ACRCS8_05490 [Brevinema sp.]
MKILLLIMMMLTSCVDNSKSKQDSLKSLLAGDLTETVSDSSTEDVQNNVKELRNYPKTLLPDPPMPNLPQIELTESAIYPKKDPLIRIEGNATEWYYATKNHQTNCHTGEIPSYYAIYWDSKQNILYRASLEKTNNIPFEIDSTKITEPFWSYYNNQEVSDQRTNLIYVGNLSALSRVYIDVTNTNEQYVKTLKPIMPNEYRTTFRYFGDVYTNRPTGALTPFLTNDGYTVLFSNQNKELFSFNSYRMDNGLFDKLERETDVPFITLTKSPISNTDSSFAKPSGSLSREKVLAMSQEEVAKLTDDQVKELHLLLIDDKIRDRLVWVEDNLEAMNCKYDRETNYKAIYLDPKTKSFYFAEFVETNARFKAPSESSPTIKNRFRFVQNLPQAQSVYFDLETKKFLLVTYLNIFDQLYWNDDVDTYAINPEWDPQEVYPYIEDVPFCIISGSHGRPFNSMASYKGSEDWPRYYRIFDRYGIRYYTMVDGWD